MKQYLKLFGERNTGTNYLEQLIRLNLDVEVLRNVVPRLIQRQRFEFPKDLYFRFTGASNLGWKHCTPDEKAIRAFRKKKSLKVVTLTKNPYSFLLSLHKRPYHNTDSKSLSLEDFVSHRWPCVHRDNHSESGFLNPVELWNSKNRAYKNLSTSFEGDVSNLTYEALLDDPEKIVSSIATLCELPVSEFENVNQSTKKDDSDFNYYRDYYLNERWQAKLTAESVEIINRHVDAGLMESFGYRLLDPNQIESATHA